MILSKSSVKALSIIGAIVFVFLFAFIFRDKPEEEVFRFSHQEEASQKKKAGRCSWCRDDLYEGDIVHVSNNPNFTRRTGRLFCSKKCLEAAEYHIDRGEWPYEK